MAKFHIGRDGTPKRCRAKNDNCPFGGSDSHFDNVEDCQHEADLRHSLEMAKSQGSLDIDVPYTESNQNTEYRRVFTNLGINSDGSMDVKHFNNHEISMATVNRFLKDKDRIAKASEQFDTKHLFISESSNDEGTNSHTQAVFYIVENFDENWTKSPYSDSYYNAKNIDWGSKPEGSLRVSDHWNFESGDEKHCITDDPTYTKGWAVGKYSNGVYTIIEKF